MSHSCMKPYGLKSTASARAQKTRGVRSTKAAQTAGKHNGGLRKVQHWLQAFLLATITATLIGSRQFTPPGICHHQRDGGTGSEYCHPRATYQPNSITQLTPQQHQQNYCQSFVSSSIQAPCMWSLQQGTSPAHLLRSSCSFRAAANNMLHLSQQQIATKTTIHKPQRGPGQDRGHQRTTSKKLDGNY